MKCRFCGAEIREGSNICEYCGSEMERTVQHRTIIREIKSPAGGVVRTVGRVVVALAGIFALVIVVTLVVVLNSDVFKENYKAVSDMSGGTPRLETAQNKLPGNETDLMGTVITCDDRGAASIEYDDALYSDIDILDEDLMEWLHDTGRSIDGVGIRFATDKEGDICELGLLSSDFFILEKYNNCYIAARDEQLISFTSEITLETGRCYGGYFSYPDMRLYWGEEQEPFSMTHMDARCEQKKSETGREYYTGEEMTVYKIMTEGTWYYCTKETYELVQEGGLLNEYQLCEEGELAYIMKK